jgi:hypothetical protein
MPTQPDAAAVATAERIVQSLHEKTFDVCVEIIAHALRERGRATWESEMLAVRLSVTAWLRARAALSGGAP